MKKSRFLFAMAGTIVLLLQSTLPVLAVDEAEELQTIKAELEAMIPEEELGKYGKGEVIGEAYMDLGETNLKESSAEENNLEEDDIEENEIMLLSNPGSPAVITPGAGHTYGSWGTCEFTVRTQTGTYLGFCAEPNSTTPSGTFSVSELNSETIKALILCYVIPELYENLGKNIFNERDRNTYAYCHAAVGYAYCGSLTGLSVSMAQGVKNMVAVTQNQMATNGTLQRYMAEYKAYVAYNAQQDIVWVEPAPRGNIKVSKTSTKPEVTNGNTSYSLNGAVYGVYSDAACGDQVATLTTDQNGNSNEAQLNAGTYWVKEIQTPVGYAWNSKIYTATVRSGETVVVKASDTPTMNPIEILLKKLDVETRQNKPQGHGTLEGALFRVEFYAGNYETDPQKQGVKATRSWIIRTDADGIGKLRQEYLVSGDEFYISENGQPALPLGTIVIREIMAPEGYQINPEIKMQKITSENKGEEFVNTYQLVEVSEQILTLDILKVQKETKIPIEGARFIHMLPDGSKEEVTTDSAGKAVIKGLTRGEHTIEESSAPDGYTRNPGKVRFTVSENNEIELKENVSTEQTGKIQFQKKESGAVLEVEDVCAPYKLLIQKKNEKGKFLKGAEFTLYQDRECKKKLTSNTTNENGELTFEGLLIGEIYYVRETKAPEGYRIPVDLDGNVQTYEISAASNPMENFFECRINQDIYRAATDTHIISGTKAERIVTLQVVNYMGMRLPETGSRWNLVLVTMGLFCVVGMLCEWIPYEKIRKRK